MSTMPDWNEGLAAALPDGVLETVREQPDPGFASRLRAELRAQVEHALHQIMAWPPPHDSAQRADAQGFDPFLKDRDV